MNMLYKDEAYKIVGAAMAVHRYLGPGMHEIVYADALEEEFRLQNIPYAREKEYKVVYKGRELRHTFVCDFVCYDKIIVELKSKCELSDIDRSQVINYLKITNMKLGLLMNFGEQSLISERFLNIHNI